MPRSQFTYPRPLLDDVAAALKATRDLSWCEPQLLILDITIDDIVRTLGEFYPDADTARFREHAGYFTHRASTSFGPPPQGETHHG
jgi:hypothetical protein